MSCLLPAGNPLQVLLSPNSGTFCYHHFGALLFILTHQSKEKLFTYTCPCVNFFYSVVLAVMAGRDDTIEVEISETDLFVINKARELRVMRQLSQVDLSILLGMSEGAVGKIENPKLRDKYNIRHINLLAKALRCSPRDLFPEKPLSNDIVRIKLRLIRQPAASKGKPNYEIIKIQPLKD